MEKEGEKERGKEREREGAARKKIKSYMLYPSYTASQRTLPFPHKPILSHCCTLSSFKTKQKTLEMQEK